MRDEVLLIYPRLNVEEWGGFWDPPLGVLYLATYLQHAGIKCDLVDATFMKDWNEFEKSLQRYQPRIVGLSFSSPMAGLGFEAAKIVKNLWSESFVVAGGPHPTVAPTQTVENKCIDAIVLGEGEIVLAQLATAIFEQRDLETVKGICYKKDGGIISNERGDFIPNLDDLPFLNRKLIDIEKYLQMTATMPISVMRGCPFNCFFCQPTQRKLFGRKVRSRSPGNIVAEMLALRKEYPQGNYIFSFQADTFTISRKWVLELCDEIITNKLYDIPWICDSRVNTIDQQIISAMKRAGCFSIHLGIESGSQRILDFLNKGITIEQSKNALRLCHENNIIPSSYIMIGTPTETEEDIESTCLLIQQTHPVLINISRVTPVPGSGIHDYVSERGMLNIGSFSDFDYYHNKYPIKLEHLTEEDLDKAYTKMMRIWLKSVITHPSFVIKLLNLLRRFPKHRRYFLKSISKSLKIGSRGKYLSSMLPFKKKLRASE